MKDGFLLLNKEPGWTSRDVCNKLSHIFDLDKVGHNGTLDPFASGVLLIASGKATRTLLFIENCEKTYKAKLIFGKKTSTGDLSGEKIEERKITTFTKSDVEKVFESMLGNQKQIPPMTSAVHYQGRKLYELAHEGKVVERKERDIFIRSLKVLDLRDNYLVFEATVSKGTYIRTLGETIAERLNNVGYLESLERTAIGNFAIKDAKKISEIKESDFLNIYYVLEQYLPIKKFSDNETLNKIKHGGKLSLKLFDKFEKNICVINEQNEPLAIYSLKDKEHYFCARNLN